MHVINRIKIVLIEQRHTGKWLAEQLGVSVTTTSRWCSNAAQPDLSTLVKIASLLDVDVKELIVSTKKYIYEAYCLFQGGTEYESVR